MPMDLRLQRGHWMKILRAALALVPAVAPLLSALTFPVAHCKGLPVDQAGATVMSYRALIEAPKKFDRKFVWVLGGLKFINRSAYLGAVSAVQPDLQKSVCVEPIESFTGSVVDPSGSKAQALLRRFDGLGVSVHGHYESATAPRCPNGTVLGNPNPGTIQ
jgi:hypothetical protein